MAEAHSAVGFQFTVTQDGLDIDLNREVLRAVWKSCVRSWKKRVIRFKNTFKSRVYPLHPSSWLIVVSLVFAVSYAGWDISRYGVSSLEYICLNWLGVVCCYHIMACVIFSFLLWLSGVLCYQFTLRLLFSYTTWMYEPRGKMRIRTKIWLGLVKLLSGRNPRLYGYQGSLPGLPVPSLRGTIARYMLSVRPLLNDAEYEEMRKLAEEFRTGISRRLQLMLLLKSWFMSNYVSDWWEDYVYLHHRSPIMVNSNYYGIETVLVPPVGGQAARAANMTYLMLQHRRTIDREELRPLFVNSTVPLCSWQYERQFNTTRIPGEKKDYLQHVRDSDHVVVCNRGRYFTCPIKQAGQRLTPADLEKMFEEILADKSEPCGGEAKLAALTAGDREPWAQARKNYFSRGDNKTSLTSIEKAAFVIALDDEEYLYDPKDSGKLDYYASEMLHGNGYNRWFDKSFTLVVGKNGRIGFNAEHSWADAPIMAHMWEICLSKDYVAFHTQDPISGYTPEGRCIAKPKLLNCHPIRLKWNIPEECQLVIDRSLATATALFEDVDLHVVVHTVFGKGFMKVCNLSPDGFIQLALQLAYFRDAGRFCLTYEASMTRMFREGRTETVRSCTVESAAFVRAMIDAQATTEDRIRTLKTAVDRHQTITRDSMTGRGVDRHLFCLYVASKYLGLESAFLKKVLSEPWRLSTSQTPHSQENMFDLEKYPQFLCAGGGFGPVADDGYGVSYVIAGEDSIFFHVSSKLSCPNTNSLAFGCRIAQALSDIRLLYDPNWKSEIDFDAELERFDSERAAGVHKDRLHAVYK